MTTHTLTAPTDISALIMRWCEFYTRDLPSRLATERQDELASDLHEHTAWAQSSGVSPTKLRRSVLARAIRGVPGDLSWRHAQRRDIPLAGRLEIRTRRANASVLAATLSAGLLVALWGSYVLTRVMISAARGDIRSWSSTAVLLSVATALAVLGVVLLARKKTRAIGAVWMIPPTVVLIPSGFYQLYSLSATVGMLFYQPNWGPATDLLTAGLVVLFLAASIWLWPSRQPSEVSQNASIAALS